MLPFVFQYNFGFEPVILQVKRNVEIFFIINFSSYCQKKSYVWYLVNYPKNC